MKRFAALLSLILVASLTAPASAAVKSVSKPSAPTISSITSSPVKKGKVNLTVVVTLGTDNGGAAVSGTKISAGGKSCTAKKAKTSCTIKGIKNGKAVNVFAKSKNKKGFSASSPAVSYVTGTALAIAPAAPAAPAIPAAPAAPAAPSIPAVTYPAGSFSGAGKLRVGVDLQPGTYRSTSSSSSGYWARLSCITGAFECILDNEITSGQSYVTILPSDSFFETSRMNQWIPEGALTGSLASSFAGTGMYKVGFDIVPGIYQATVTGSSSGYWSRLSCATGAFECINDNDITSGTTIVEILPSDVFFTTNRHGTWTKIG